MMKKYLILLAAVVTLFSCTKNNESLPAASDSGTGGSLARFTIVGNYLYTMSDETLTTYDISNPAKPVLKNSQQVGFNVETIFPYGNKLFMGGQAGFYIYDLNHPASPEKLGMVQHLRSCDPVVANDSIAFVSLRAGTRCSITTTNALYVYDIRQPLAPKEIYVDSMNHPEGLGLKDSTLFVCDSTNIIVMNVKDPYHPVRIDTLSDHGEVYHDVIPYQHLLICMVKSGILLYDISDPHAIGLLGQMKY